MGKWWVEDEAGGREDVEGEEGTPLPTETLSCKTMITIFKRGSKECMALKGKIQKVGESRVRGG